jgi:hypothetical protein
MQFTVCYWFRREFRAGQNRGAPGRRSQHSQVGRRGRGYSFGGVGVGFLGWGAVCYAAGWPVSRCVTRPFIKHTGEQRLLPRLSRACRNRAAPADCCGLHPRTVNWYASHKPSPPARNGVY